MAQLSFKNIYKKYDRDMTIVKNFNLEVNDGEFIVLVGPSGCGKSTTLRMIAGLEEISEGDFYIDGKRVNDVTPKDRDIAMVFQNYALYPHMSVYDNMAFGLKLRKYSKAEIDQRVKHAAQILGLEKYLDRKPKALSGGQRQRVALGRAIVRNAKVFLMDEPLSNLDAKLRVQMRAEITKLHQQLQTTTVYVTHDQIEAMTMATRLVVLKDGIIQQVGTPKEVYEKPENVFVGGFIGSPGMNFFKGIVTENAIMIDKWKIEVSEEKMKSLQNKGYANKEIIIGIRPEDFYYGQAISSLPYDAKVKVTIDVAELMGSETYLYSNINGQSFVARVNSSVDVHSQVEMDLALNMDKVHYFDFETEKRIVL